MTRLRVATGLGMIAAVTALLTTSAASATPPTGPAPPSPGEPVVGVLDGGTRAKQDGIVLKVRRDTRVRTFTLTYPIGSSSGWHSHPGIVLATVESGSVVRRVGCRSERFRAGESFTEVAPHLVRNYYRSDKAGAVPAVLSITQLLPADATTPRVEAEPPRCS